MAEQRKLLQRSGDRCAFETCRRQLTANATSDDPLVACGQIAHIVAQKTAGPRGGEPLPINERDRYENLILLCGDHHKAVDSQRNFYTVERLRAMKDAHEKWVADTLGSRTYVDIRDLVEISAPNRLYRLSELNPYDLGVTASRYGDSSSYGKSDPYVCRTSGGFDDKLSSSLQTHDFVVIVGASKAGKSRSAFEIARRGYPNTRLIYPWPDRLSEVVTHPVVAAGEHDLILWLDDIDNYLVSSDPLTLSLLRKLLDRTGTTKIIGTLRSEQRALLLGDASELPDDDEHPAYLATTVWCPDDPKTRQDSRDHPFPAQRRDPNQAVDIRNIRRILQVAKTITLEPTSEDEAEQRQAAEAYPHESLQFGLGAQLAGGPEMLRVYRDADEHNPPLHAVIQVAVDWSRCGRADPISEELLTTCAQKVLARKRRDRDFGPEQISRAIEKARTPRTSDGKAVALITHRGAGQTRAYRPFVYLVSADDGQDGHARHLHDDDWLWAVTGADANQAHAVANMAYARGALVPALELAEQASRLGNPEAMFLTAYLHQISTSAGSLAKAVTWYRQAAQAGHLGAMKNLAELLSSSDEHDKVREAEQWFSQAALTGDAPAMRKYADYLLTVTDPPRLDEATDWMEKAATAGDKSAMQHMGNLLMDAAPADIDGARRWLQQAVDAGSTNALVSLGYLLVHHYNPPKLDEARKLYRVAVDAGNKRGLVGEAEMISNHTKKADLKTAKRLYAQAAEGSSDAYVLAAYGNFLYRKAKRPHPEAEEWLRKAAATGDPTGKFDLAQLLLDSSEPSNVDEGVRLLAEAAEAGVVRAMCRLASLYRDDHPSVTKDSAVEHNPRRRWFRKRSPANDENLPEAMKWYARAACCGHVHAMLELSNICMVRCDPPDYSTSRRWLERAATAGDVDAMYTLGGLIGYSWRPPDLEKGVEWYTRAAEAGHVLAMHQLSHIARRESGPRFQVLAQHWLTRAARAGLVEAMLELGEYSLTELNDIPGAVNWYREAAKNCSTTAMTALAEIYLEHSQPPNVREVRRWLTEAANHGDRNAMWWLADVLEQTHPVQKLEARRWRDKAEAADQ